MKATQTFRELTYTMRPQDPHGDGIRLRFETGEHGGDYPDNMPQDAIHTRGRQLTVGCAFRPDGQAAQGSGRCA